MVNQRVGREGSLLVCLSLQQKMQLDSMKSKGCCEAAEAPRARFPCLPWSVEESRG